MIETGAEILIQPQARTDRHRLAGVVTVDGSPAQRRVVVCKRVTLEIVAQTLSDSATGAWELYGMAEYDEESLIVLTLDNSGTCNAEVADYVSQVIGEEA